MRDRNPLDRKVPTGALAAFEINLTLIRMVAPTMVVSFETSLKDFATPIVSLRTLVLATTHSSRASVSLTSLKGLADLVTALVVSLVLVTAPDSFIR